MPELTVHQIAATLAGQLGRPESELRLLSLFGSAAGEHPKLESDATRKPLPKAA